MPDYVPFLFIGVAIIVGAVIISGGLYALANAIKKINQIFAHAPCKRSEYYDILNY